MSYNSVVSTEKIIEKWYKELEFPKEYDTEFYRALDEIKIPDSVSVKNYDLNETDGKRNLLSYLYMCEQLKMQYAHKGISTDVLYDNLKDIVRWTQTWTEIKGSLYLGETHWLVNHLDMNLFKLGRLQYNMGEMPGNISFGDLAKGDKIIEIHIPACGPLKREDCEKSIQTAKDFFAKYYPAYSYKAFTCHSWLLDTSLKEILSADSNIIQFQNMFDIINGEKSDAILKYVFKWDTTRDGLNKAVCTSDFAEKVKKRILSGADFYESYGILSMQ